MTARRLLGLALLLASALGCDADKAAFTRAAEAEAAGNPGEAEARYREACERGSALCPKARGRIERLALKKAWRALEEERFAEAKQALDALQAAGDSATRASAAALLGYAELTQGLEWEAASALADRSEALPRMEALAEQGTLVSSKARAWLAAARPGILLARVEAACAPEGKGPCVEAGDRLSSKHPASPEAERARDLVLAERRRIAPLLAEAERLLKQRVELYDKEQLVEICMSQASLPADFSLAPCEARVLRGRALPSAEQLAASWAKTLGAIHDPFFTRGLAERWKAADAEGVYDPAR